MIDKIPILLSWSGGKDAAFSLYKLRREGVYEVKYLLTTFNAQRRVSMHEIPEALIEAQAERAGIPLLKVNIPENTPGSYEAIMRHTLTEVQNQGINTVAFGDIFLEDLRNYRINQLEQLKMKAVFPLWKIDPEDYQNEFFISGFKSVICCVNESMLDAAFCGRELTTQLMESFPPKADICGENGEYHSFCYEGPVFKKPVGFQQKGFFKTQFPAPENKMSIVTFRHLSLDII